MISHENMMSATTAAILQLGEYAPNKTDILFSFLPLSHTLEMCCELSVILAGGAIAYYSGNIKQILQDMKSCSPTVLPAVPRFINKTYDRAVKKANRTAFSRHIFNMPLSFKTEELYKGIVRKTSMWDKLIFW